MKTATFSCPYCSSPLRIRDRAFVDREVGCPECGERLEVTLDRDKEPVAQKVAPDNVPQKQRKRGNPGKSGPAGKSKKRTRKRSEKPSNGKPQKTFPLSRKPLFTLGERFSGVPEVLLSPVGIAWFVAGFVALVLLVLAWPAGESAQPQNSQQAASKQAEEESSKANDPPKPTNPLPDRPEPSQAVDDEAIARRMTELGGMIHRSVERRGHYPIGTVAVGNQSSDERFSWLADLFVQEADPKVQEPQWDRPWSDILNDRFVRQQREMFLNPELKLRVGELGYPATHFVGVAGVGADAPRLPVDHPRAGIFGIDRATRPEDIKDGAANTMMVAGASGHFGSWAAGGRPSLRAFTQEPYIGGPDGFGTGQQGGMSVLMADGSVRFLSEDTDPAVIRQMAAMSDEFYSRKKTPDENDPLVKIDHSKPSPTVVEKPLPPKSVVAEKPESAAAQIPEENEPESQETVDIPAALAVKIKKFEQVKSAPLVDLLFQVEELTGVPMRRDPDLPEADDEFWTQPVSLKLNDATVRQILEALLDKANLQFSIEDDHIRVYKAD